MDELLLIHMYFIAAYIADESENVGTWKVLNQSCLKKSFVTLTSLTFQVQLLFWWPKQAVVQKNRERKAEQEVSKVSLHTCQKQKQKRTAAMHC